MSKSYTPKQRVLDAIAHIEPDRPPINIYVTPEIDSKLRRFFNNRDYYEAFQVDFRSVSPKNLMPPVPPASAKAKIYDEWGVGYTQVTNSAQGTYWEATDLALARLNKMDEVERYPWPNPDNYDYSVIPAQIERSSDYAICLGDAGIPDIINGVGRGRGMEQVLVDIITEDEIGIAIIDKRIDFYYQYLKRGLEAGGGRIDILCLGEDLGSQKGPTMSPDIFDRFFRPRIQKFYDLGHSYGAKVMMHSCGSTRLLQPRLIEMGLDILDAVQPEPYGMDPEELKAEFGDRLTYSGMISTQQTLPHGSEEQCRQEARHRLDVIGRGGGYIFAPAHCIQPDTPLENVLAIYEEATGQIFLQH